MTQSDTGLTDRGSEVASSTKGHASDVASSATEQAKGVAQEAKQQWSEHELDGDPCRVVDTCSQCVQ